MADKTIWDTIWPIVWRVIRGSVATFIATWVAAIQNDPNWVWLAPAIMALGKGLRDKWPQYFEWLPI